MPTLDWLNRAAAFTTAARVPYRLLEQVSIYTPTAQTMPVQAELITVRPEPVEGSPAPTNSTRTEITDNLLIQGDNLEALKALLPFYHGQVKCSFIDPPYNTKSAFEHYNDNLEHAQWLSMMLPRLQLLRELLRKDGSIWVTNDDSREKRLVGQRWAQTTGQRFVMVEKMLNGMDMAAQIRAAVKS